MLLASAQRVRLRYKQPGWLTDLGPEDADKRCEVYLLTFSRVLTARLQRGDLKDVATLSRRQVLACVRDAWDAPYLVPAVPAALVSQMMAHSF